MPLILIFTLVARKPDYNSGYDVCPKRLDTLNLARIEICVRSARECGGHTLGKMLAFREV